MNESDLNKNTRVVDASSILRENLENLESSDLRAYAQAGLISEKALKTILSMKNGLERAGIDYRKDKRYKRLLENQISHTANKAVAESDISTMAHLNGRTHDSSSISQFHRIKALKEILTVVGRSYIFKGEPDTGKTNMALLMAEIWQDATDGIVYTNMESVKQFKTVQSFDKLQKEFEKDYNDDKPKLMIVEDASNHFSGYAVDKDVMEEKYRPFSNELAKNNAIIFLLGHTGMDIHADARRKSLLVDKPSLKTTKIFRRIKNGKGTDRIFKMTEIPKTSYSYDSTEKTKWMWDSESDEPSEEELKMNEIQTELVKRLKKNREVKTVDLPYNNGDVADVMRHFIQNNAEGFKLDDSSPISIKRKVH